MHAGGLRPWEHSSHATRFVKRFAGVERDPRLNKILVGDISEGSGEVRRTDSTCSRRTVRVTSRRLVSKPCFSNRRRYMLARCRRHSPVWPLIKRQMNGGSMRNSRGGIPHHLHGFGDPPYGSYCRRASGDTPWNKRQPLPTRHALSCHRKEQIKSFGVYCALGALDSTVWQVHKPSESPGTCTTSSIEHISASLVEKTVNPVDLRGIGARVGTVHTDNSRAPDAKSRSANAKLSPGPISSTSRPLTSALPRLGSRYSWNVSRTDSTSSEAQNSSWDATQSLEHALAGG